MATDSTNLPQGGTTLDVSIDMTSSDLDLTVVQVAQTEPAGWVDLPKGKTIVLLPVQPGQRIELPTDSTGSLLAKIGPEGNLAIVVDGRTIILQGYLEANQQSPIKIVTNDGDAVDIVDVIAATDSSLDIQTAAGPATGGQGDSPDGSGIYIPFLVGPGLGGIDAEGILDPTALQYRLIDDTRELFDLKEDDEAGDEGASVTTSAVVGVEGDECVYEDTFAPLSLTATPGTADDQVTQIVLDDIPAGWTLDTSAIIISGGGALGGFTLVGDTLTIDITGAPAGVAITATLAIKAADDSDVDGNNLIVRATVIDGALVATGSSTFDVEVDAVADGDDKGDDGDIDALAVTIDVTDSDGDGNASFQVGEVGHVKVGASYDDFRDGSETHSLVVDAPEGFSFDLENLGTIPSGVTLDEDLSTTSHLVFEVDSKDGDGQNGVGDFALDIPVTYVGGQPDGSSGKFSATVSATETPTDHECTDTNNQDTATASDSAEIFTPPVPDVRLGVEGNTDAICVPEDSADIKVPLEAQATTPDSHLTQIVISRFPVGGADFGVDFSLFDGIATITNNIAVDGTVTIVFDAPQTDVTGYFTVTPLKADSDLDLGLLTATVTAVSDLDLSVSGTDSDQTYVRVDAVADGTDNDAVNLTVSIDVVDGGDANSTFHAGEAGAVKIHATFDDYVDGSETHSLTVKAPDGFAFDLVQVAASLPSGVTLDGSSSATNVLLIVDSKDGDGQPGIGTLDLEIPVTYAGGVDGAESGDFAATATAAENNSVATNGDGNDECTDENNKASVSAQDRANLNSGPSIALQGHAVVSDEGLAFSNPDSDPVPADETNSNVASGTFVVSDPDASDVLTVELLTDGLPALKFAAETVSWSVDPDGHTLHGKTGGTDAITVEISTIDGTNYSYDVTLHKPLDHPLTNEPGTPGTETSFEDEVPFNVSIKVTDSGGLSSTTALNVEIEDDRPNPILLPIGDPIVIDESIGADAGDPLSGDELASVDGADIGYFKSALGSLFTSVENAGADQPADTTYALQVNAGNSLLFDTETGEQVVFSVNASGIVEGHAGIAGPLVMTISIQSGALEVHQYRAVEHDDPSDPDEAASPATIALGIIDVVMTVTDKDGDSVSAKSDLGARIQIQDDGPAASVIFKDSKDVLDDEGAPLAGFAGIEGASTPADDVAGAPVSVSFDVNVDAGADGLGSIAYNLAQIQAQNAGLKAVDGTSDGAAISFSLEGGDLVGRISEGPMTGTLVLKAVATDADSFTVTQHSPLFHSNSGESNDLAFSVVLNVSDKDGDTIQTTATVKIDDDMPNAMAQSGEAEAQPRTNTNLLLILDDSGSMVGSEGETDLQNVNKLQALQAAVNELFEQYGNLGEVRVCFVRFDATASTLTSGGDVWLTLDQAKELLATLSGGGATNYDDALLEAIASYQASGKLEPGDVTGPIQNVGYFISDGAPNNNQQWNDPYNVGASWTPPATAPGVSAADGDGKLNQEEEYLQNFLKGEDIKMFSIGIGSGIDDVARENLKNISYDGKNESDDDGNLYIELQDLSQLSQTLVGTVVVPIGGAISGFGADGGFVSQLTLPGGFQVNYDGFQNAFTVTGGGGSDVTGTTVNPSDSPIEGGSRVIRITLATGSTFYINMFNGAWQYVPAPGDGGSYNFGFTLTDYDGDTSSSTLTIITDIGGFKPIVRDDSIITNIAGSFSIVDKALLWNDEEKDVGQTVAISPSQADITNATGTVTRDVADIDVSGDATKFTYKGTSADGSDTGNVSITRVAGSTLTGNGLDNVLIAGNGDDTLLGYQGNDVLLGGAGNDVLRPGTGKDFVDGGAGTNDILDYSDVGGSWSLTLGAGGSGTTNVAGEDRYAGIEGVNGGSGSNVITGNSAGNNLNGNDGDDTLDGGNDAVADTLNGGGGNDTLIWHDASDTFNGGAGGGKLDAASFDVLDVSGGTTIDLTSIANSQLSGIETIRMSGGGNQILTLNSQDVVDLGQGVFNPQGSGFPDRDALRVDGDVGDVLNLSKGAEQWVDITASINNEPSGYRVFAFGAGTAQSYVIVDADVTVNIVA